MILENEQAGRIAAEINSQANPFHLRACLFHSTPVSERRRGTHWDSATFANGDPKSAEFLKMIIMKAVANPNLPLISAAFFHSTPYLSVKKRVYWPQSHSRGPPRLRFKLVYKNSQFLRLIDDHQNVRFGNPRAEGPKTQDYSSFKNSEKEYSSKKSLPANISYRQALGLSATGPLTLDQVKIAYRQSAMKWHPDHHQGLGKALAEAHFKKINAAHESLCNEISKA